MARTAIHLINDEVFIRGQVATATTRAWVGADGFLRGTIDPATGMARDRPF